LPAATVVDTALHIGGGEPERMVDGLDRVRRHARHGNAGAAEQ